MLEANKAALAKLKGGGAKGGKRGERGRRDEGNERGEFFRVNVFV